MTQPDDLKRAAAEEAVARYVRSGTVVGLGSGSTSDHVVRRIGELLRRGELRDVVGVPTSRATEVVAEGAGVPLTTLAEARPSLTVDGTDEISADLALIKGRGGALLREKIVAAASERGIVVVADGSKRVERLGVGRLPVEVEPFGWETTMRALGDLGCRVERRVDVRDPSRPFVTDGGHYTVDCLFASVEDPAELERRIKAIPGALESGLFVGLAFAAVIADAGGVEVVEAGG